MLHLDMTPEQMEAAKSYIHERFWQLNNLMTGHSQNAQRYCFLINAGGAVAALSYLGATEGKGVLANVQFSLAFFLLGILFVGGLISNVIHRVDRLLNGWRRDTGRFYLNQIHYETLLENDNNRLGSDFWAYLFGYLSFGSFIIGISPHLWRLFFG